MKQQISFQTAFGKALLNTFGNRQRGGQARAGGRIKKSWRTTGAFLCASLLLTLFCWAGWQAVKADSSIGNVAVGSDPISVAVNPVTNKIYVANCGSLCGGVGGTGSGNVTVIDGTNNQATTIAAGTNPIAVAVNPVTNKIYVANFGSANVTVIDGTNNSTATVAAGTNPRAVAVNSVTNTIYVGNNGSSNVTVINGATNTVAATVPAGSGPQDVALNPATNKVYVANLGGGVTVIDGTNNTVAATVTASNPVGVVVNPATNKIYAVNQNTGFTSSLTVIDGTNNSSLTINDGGPGRLWTSIALNPVTNKIYITAAAVNAVVVFNGINNSRDPDIVGGGQRVAVNPITNKVYSSGSGGSGVTVIDGSNNSTTTVATAIGTSYSLAVNPVTNKIYATNRNDNSVTVINGDYNTTATVATGTQPSDVAVNPATNKIYVANNTTNNVTVIDGTNNSATTVAVGTGPFFISAIGVNPITNKIYVANQGSNNVTVIDGTNNSTTTVATGLQPWSVAVNPVTNKIYVANNTGNNVTVIDGTNNSTTMVATGSGPFGFGVNPVTNKIYVANSNSANVTVIDGTNNSTTTVAVGTTPYGVGVNPVTNKIYVANFGSSNVTVIDGTNNATATVAAGTNPFWVAANRMTNKIYVGNNGSGNVTVIDGTNNSTTTVAVGTAPNGVTINPATNKIYVANNNTNNVTVIDGTNNTTQTAAAGISPYTLAVNPVTNKIYVGKFFSGTDITVITPAPASAIPLNTTVTPLAGNTTSSSTPTFTLTATSTYSPNAPPPRNIYFQMDTANRTWTKATNTGSTATTVTATATPATLQNGIHILYFFAADGSDATSINPARPFEEKFNGGSENLAPESSSIIGGINAYLFLVAPVTCPTITVNPANPTLPVGQAGVPYNQTFTQTGGTGTATFTISAGALPTGVMLSTAGVLSGTPTPAGSFSFTVKATDTNGCMGTQAYTLAINTCPTITLSPATLPTGMAGSPYDQTITASGGAAPYTFTISAGTLPTGVMLSAGGLLSGTPTGFGTFNFTVKATASNGCMGTRAYTLVINPPCGTITVNPATLANGFVGTGYSQPFTQSGGTGTITWSVSAGVLPGGLSLNSSTGILSGTPTTAGTFSFTVKATDANGCMGTHQYTVIVSGTGLQFYPLALPVRLLDTRSGTSPNACSQPNTPIASGTSLTQPARGICTIPANAAAITGNVTTVNSGGGFLTLYPSGATQPTVASTNYGVNEVINNVFTVGLGAADGAFKIFALNSTDVVVDVTGYYAPPAAGGLYFHPLPSPVRLLETRDGQPIGCIKPGAPLTGGQDSLQTATTACTGIPAAARAIVGNATTVSPQGGGFLTLFPADATRPTVASSNYNSGQVVNGPFTVGLSATGQFKIFTLATTDLIVDVLGYYSTEATDANGAGLLLTPLAQPVRLLETRSNPPTLTGCFKPNAPLNSNQVYTQPARGLCDGLTVPATALGVVGNATVVTPLGGGYLTLWPSSAAQPTVATANYNSGQVVNRHFIVGLGSGDGAFKMFSAATTDLVIDLSGYFAP